MPELFGKFERQYSYKLYIYPFTRKSFRFCLKLKEAILKNISNENRYKFQKQLLYVLSTNSCPWNSFNTSLKYVPVCILMVKCSST